LDTYLVRFRLTQPLGTFLDKLRIGILPEHALRGTSASQLASHLFNFTPIGTGPYQLENMQTEGSKIQIVNLRAAPVYRQRREGQEHPFALERVSFHLYDTFDQALQAIQTGVVDGLASRDRNERNPMFQASNAYGLNTQNAYEPTFGAIVFNWTRESTRFFREQRVRVALDTGLDRTALIDRAMPNLAMKADGPILPLSWAYQPNLPQPAYNVAAARQLLETASARLERIEGQNEQTDAEATAEPESPYFFTFNILTPNEPALVNLTREIATQWSQLNLNVSVDAVDLPTYQSRLESGDFDAALVEYSFGESADPDLYAFWHQGQNPADFPEGKNYGGADDRRISELLERARREPFGVNRALAYQDFQRLFVERAIALPLYYPLFTYLLSPRVDGVQLGFIGSPADRFRNIGDWSLRR
jgi:peptide/nickel transport system substrate-binding protein